MQHLESEFPYTQLVQHFEFSRELQAISGLEMRDLGFEEFLSKLTEKITKLTKIVDPYVDLSLSCAHIVKTFPSFGSSVTKENKNKTEVLLGDLSFNLCIGSKPTERKVISSDGTADFFYQTNPHEAVVHSLQQDHETRDSFMNLIGDWEVIIN